MGERDSPPKAVSFGEVRVRQHERILARRASEVYAKLEIGWAHNSSSHCLVDDFEKEKRALKDNHDREHKYREFERLQTLAKYGYTTRDILALEKEKKQALLLRTKGIEVPSPENEQERNSAAEDKSAGSRGLRLFLGRVHRK